MPAIANPSASPAAVPPLPSGTTRRAGARELTGFDLVGQLERGVHVA